MFWALLYFTGIRYSSEPVRLAQNSPVRLLFQKHGGNVSRHPIATILTLTIIFVALCYPLPYLYSFDRKGSVVATTTPHHVWTTARQSTAYQEPDIAIKQAWVQGSYMGALDEQVLEDALQIQRHLLGDNVTCSSTTDTLSEDDISENMQESIKNDKDLLDTVNHNYLRHSTVNVTLRWGTVLAGKRFLHHRLVEADALVISLFYKPNSRAGLLWDERAVQLARNREAKDRWNMYPSTGLVTHDRNYEFVFQPMSLFDILAVLLIYGLLLVYLYDYLRGIHAIRSRLGLFVTVVLQCVASIMASFTIVALLKIPVTHIPREFYPFVVMVIGLENMSRLTKAVFQCAPQYPVQQRIALALGEVGASSTVAIVFDLVVLFIVSQFSSQEIGEYCAFAAIAVTLDFILHLTFFIAVLSVDINRAELLDSIEKMNMRDKIAKKDRRGSTNLQDAASAYNSARDFFTQKTSTRVAGTAIMICFIVGLNYHFLENEPPLRTLYALLDHIRGISSTNTNSTTSTDLPINQARTPTAWLRLQDQQTGMELIRAVKPGAYRMIAKAYDPLYFVLKNASRDKPQQLRNGLVKILDFDRKIITDHAQALIYTLVVTSAFITIILNFLLRHDPPDDNNDTIDDKEQPHIVGHVLEGIHNLDVVYMATSRRGHLVSVGLDRKIVLWNLQGLNTAKHFSPQVIAHTTPHQKLWPILAIAIDEGGEWVAIAPRTGLTWFWNVRRHYFVSSVSIDYDQRRPLAFFFAKNVDLFEGPRLIVVRPNGSLLDVSAVRQGDIIEHDICQNVRAICAQSVQSRLPFQVITACRKGRMWTSTKKDRNWTTVEIIVDEPQYPEFLNHDSLTIQLVPILGIVVRVRQCTVDLISLTGQIIHTIQSGQVKANTFRVFHSRRKICYQCHKPSVKKLSMVYEETDSNMIIMHTLMPRSQAVICIRVNSNETKCGSFENAIERTHWIDGVESWEASAHQITGLRKQEKVAPETNPFFPDFPGARRRRNSSRTPPISTEEEDWEAWVMSANGEMTSYSLRTIEETQPGSRHRVRNLLVSKAGPAIKIGSKSIAIAFGESVKLLVAGTEKFTDTDDEDDFANGAAVSRHKRGLRKKQQ